MATTESMTDHVFTGVDDGIMTIRLNRPEKKNALTIDMYRGVSAGVVRGEADPSVRVMVLRGTDDCFCSGNDVIDFKNATEENTERPRQSMIPDMFNATKPIIAAVSGYAIGIGTTMLLHCDLVYAGAGTVFRLPFVNLGICPEAGSSYLLPRLAGYQRAAELIFLGEKFDAETARDAGIVSTVFPDQALHERVLQKARQLAAQPPSALRMAKAMLRKGTAAAIQEAMAMEGENLRERMASPEAAEAFRAFAERRKPDFSQFA